MIGFETKAINCHRNKKKDIVEKVNKTRINIPDCKVILVWSQNWLDRDEIRFSRHGHAAEKEFNLC